MPAIRTVGLAGVIGGLGLVMAFTGAIYAFQTTTVRKRGADVLGLAFRGGPPRLDLSARKGAARDWAAIGLAMIGLYIMVREGLGSGAVEGNIAALLSALGFGAFSVALRWGRVSDMMPAALLGSLFATSCRGLHPDGAGRGDPGLAP